jgi:hypothetical protein
VAVGFAHSSIPGLVWVTKSIEVTFTHVVGEVATLRMMDNM